MSGPEHFVATLERFLARWQGLLLGGGLLAVFLIVGWNALTLAGALPVAETVLLLAALSAVGVGLALRSGLSRALDVAGTLAVYAGAVAIGFAVRDAIVGDAAIAPWRAWLAVSAIFVIGLRLAVRHFHPEMRLAGLSEAEKAEHLTIRLAATRRRAQLHLLPAQGWYELASWVTGAAMVGSFATTSIGFYHEIVDPLDAPLVRYGIPVGLSALAALIIWAGWNFVFLRLRLAGNMVSRLFGYAIGLAVLVPMTLAIHTVFGIIGVGGTEGIRAHNLWYADVLDAYERRVDGIRAIEANRLQGALTYMSSQLQAAAQNEETTGQGCGAGRGSLWSFYTDSAAHTRTILGIVETRKSANLDIKSEIEALRGHIRRPERKLEEMQPELAAEADAIRKKIMETDNSSVLPSVRTFVKETSATVNSPAFFSGWSACTLTKKDVILTQINTLLGSIDEAATAADDEIAAARQSPTFRIPVETRIESIPFVDMLVHGEAPARATAAASEDDVPVFVPLRPFWAVVSYAGSLMGYIALQLALDLSPAVLGLLFALLAPFPRRRTVLGRAWDGFWSRRVARWFPDEPAPVGAAATPAVAPAPTVAPTPVPDADPAPVPRTAPAATAVDDGAPAATGDDGAILPVPAAAEPAAPPVPEPPLDVVEDRAPAAAAPPVSIGPAEPERTAAPDVRLDGPAMPAAGEPGRPAAAPARIEPSFGGSVPGATEDGGRAEPPLGTPAPDEDSGEGDGRRPFPRDPAV